MAQNLFQFFAEPSLQELFRDKDTGLPLSNGEITFFKDNDRTLSGLKPVYQLTGTPANPVYIELPNPLTLTGIGTTSNGFGVDTKIYFNPFDDEGNPELYYIEVRNSDTVLQFTREGWPQQIPSESNINFSFIENFVQDGQFLHHFDLPNAGVIPLSQNITNISYGGWVFILSNGFSSTNTITFDRFSDYVINPSVSPRYALNVNVTSPNPAETQKDITWVNNNVNFLAGKTVTMQFEAISKNGVPANVNIFYEKEYGSGGSANESFFVGTISVQPTDYEKYTISFDVSDNLGKTISSSDDDEIRFIIRLPTDLSIDISFTNIMLVEGEFSVLNFPEMSDYDASLKALASSIDGPAFNNSDAGKVLTLGGRTDTAIGQTGTPLAALVWQNSVPTGFIFESYLDPTTIVPGYLYCNGDAYDLVGPVETDQNISNYNQLFNAIGTNAGIGNETFLPTKTVTAEFTLTCGAVNSASPPDAGTTGFTVLITTPGTPSVFQVVTVLTISGASIPPGSILEVFSPSGRSTKYWFSVDGVGIGPTGGTDLIKEISISSTDTADQVADILVANAIAQVRVPDKRASFSRGMDDGRGVDPDVSSRTDPTFGNIVGDVVGSVQQDAVEDHTHSSGQVGAQAEDGTGVSQFVGGQSGPVSGATASTETRPFNDYITCFIKT